MNAQKKVEITEKILNCLSKIYNIIEEGIKFLIGVAKMIKQFITEGLIPVPVCPTCKKKIRPSEDGRIVCDCTKNDDLMY